MFNKNNRVEANQIRKAKYAQAQSERLGMAWFLFTINFRLFAGIVGYVVDFLSAVEYSADEETLIITGIICILFSAVNLYVRHSLSCFHRNSVKLYFIVNYAISIVLSVFAALITGDISTLPSSSALLLIIIPELIYYNKRSHLFDVIPKKGKSKNMQISNKRKALIVGVVYAFLIFIQFAAFTPYTTTRTYISSQNVPHTITIDSGYSSFGDSCDGFNHTDAYVEGVTRMTNYTLFTFQLVLTTSIAALAYYFLCYKKQTSAHSNNDCDEQENLKRQNVQMQQTIESPVAQNNKIELENTSLREQIVQFTDSTAAATEDLYAQETVSLDDVPLEEPPYIDVNELAFADEDTIRKAQKQYAEDLYRYFKEKDKKNCK